MNEQTNADVNARPRVRVTPYLEALDYDARYHQHRAFENQEPEVVSLSNYVCARSMQFLVQVAGTALICLTALAVLAAVYIPFKGVQEDADPSRHAERKIVRSGVEIQEPPDLILPAFVGSLIVLTGAGLLYWAGMSCYREADTIDAGVVRARESAEDLTEEEILVRASAQPKHMERAILLRSAPSNPQTPPEQLVRPVGIQE